MARFEAVTGLFRGRRRMAFVIVPALLVAGCSLGTPKPATYVTDVRATLNAEVSSNQAGEVLYWFEWGKTTNYGNVTPDRALTFPEGHDAEDPPVPVSEPITGLEPDTTYHYRACTSPGAQAGSRGCVDQDQAFTTGAAGSSKSGIAFASNRSGRLEIWSMNAAGSDLTNITDGGSGVGVDFSPAWSPDGARIAFSFNSVEQEHSDIWIMDSSGGNRTPLTTLHATDDRAVWSPDGTRIAFESERDSRGSREIYVMDADGGNQTNLTANPDADDFQAGWSPDGSKIAFASLPGGDDYEIVVMDADGSNPVSLTDDPALDQTPAWSPDGRKIAFSSDRDGTEDIYVMDSDGGNPVPLTSGGGDQQDPVWSPDGTRIAFHSTSPNEVYVMDADGSNLTNLTNNPALDFTPDWSRRP